MNRMLICACWLLIFAALMPAKNIIGKVTKILDANTILVEGHKKAQYTVRLYGIYAPEREQAFGIKAMQETGVLCLGKIVKLSVVGKDFDGKLFCNVYTEDGTFVNEQLIARGYAWHYKKQAGDKRLALLEETARDAKLGLWADPDPVPPWKFRDGH